MIFNFGPMIEHGKGVSPYMDAQGSKIFFPWDENFGRFQRNEGSNVNLFNVIHTWFRSIIVLKNIWDTSIMTD